MNETLIVLDFGSQYTQLIARRVREQKVFCRILPYNAQYEEVFRDTPRGVILSGSPANVYHPKAPLPDARIFEAGVPVLGICYGLQVIAHLMGGKVHKSDKREYGSAELTVGKANGFFEGLPKNITCWMSHGDKLDRMPEGFESIGHTANSPIAAVAHPGRRIYGVQFHPEVVHTPQGSQILGNFLFNICKFKGNWTPESFVQESVGRIQKQVGKARVVLGLSGGVDSSVAALLLHRAVGRQLTCIFVDNGLLRLGEADQVKKTFRGRFKLNLCFVVARTMFLKALKGVEDPERKRKIIGRVFIEVFEKEARALMSFPRKRESKSADPRLRGDGKNVLPFLAQGTLYPDVIESVSVYGGPTSLIKSHHNVGGLPKGMRFKLIEPLRELFKDEVRAAGKVLGLPEDILNRHPFPGPGLAVRIIGDVTEERLELVRKADWIVIDELKRSGYYDQVWQAFAVLLPIKSVGVMGDERTYENVAAVRAVTSLDGMTADWARLPADLLGRVSNRIINEVRGINRVCYDISSKPPATIEWE